MEILKIISFISKKYPKYKMVEGNKYGLPFPVNDEGYEDEDGTLQGLWSIQVDELSNNLITYKDGVKDGPYKEYSNGVLRKEGQYINDKEEGEWRVYSSVHNSNDNTLLWKQHWSNGEPVGIWEKFYQGTGKLYKKGQMSKSMTEIGWWELYSTNGNLMAVSNKVNQYALLINFITHRH